MDRRDTSARTATVEEAARQLGISRTLAYELAKADRLPVPVIRLGRRLVIPRAALDRVLEGPPSGPTRPDGEAA